MDASSRKKHDEWVTEQYEQLQHPILWQLSAMPYWKAARIVIRELHKEFERKSSSVKDKSFTVIDCDPGYEKCSVLYGYLLLVKTAIESLLKGLCIKNDPSKISPKSFHTDLRTHDLIELATLAGLSFEGRQKELLKLLTADFRYPVSLKKEHHYLWQKYEGLSGTQGLIYPYDIAIIEEIYKQLFDQF